MRTVRGRSDIRWTRILAIGSLIACLTPMAVVVNGCFTLASLAILAVTRPDARIIPAGEASRLKRGQGIALRLRDGTRIRGTFRGRALLEDELYARRFASRAATGAWTPFRLGDSLEVERVDRRTLAAPFAGYAMRALLLRMDPRTAPVRVPFDSARSVRGPGGVAVSLDSLLAADVRGELPSAEALTVDEGIFGSSIADTQLRRVAFEDISTATVRLRGRNARVMVLVGVGLDLVLIVAWAASASNSHGSASCSSPATYSLQDLGVPRTERPFDVVHARFIDESVAVSDSVATRWAPAAEGAASAVETSASTK